MAAGWSSLLCFRLEFLGDAALGLAFHRIRLSMKALSHSSAPSMSATKSCASSSATTSTDSSATILRVSATWYWRKREKLVERTAVAILKGDTGDGQDVLVRVHSECLTGDVFGSARCDCGNQLDLAMQLIEQAGRGVVLYLRGHEGRGIGLGHKLQAYNLQDQGHDTVEANLELGLAADAREYGIGAQILRDVGVRTMRLMTNNPAKFIGLKGYGLAIVGRVPVLTPITDENRKYLETKRLKMGHVYGSDIQGPLSGFLDSVSNSDEFPQNKPK